MDWRVLRLDPSLPHPPIKLAQGLREAAGPSEGAALSLPPYLPSLQLPSPRAFEKLAEPGIGVMGMMFRSVPCGHQPDKPAPPVANPYQGEAPPPGWNQSMDMRPWP